MFRIIPAHLQLPDAQRLVERFDAEDSGESARMIYHDLAAIDDASSRPENKIDPEE